MANVMQRADVGMVQARDGPSLAIEALPGVRTAGEMLGQDLDGDGAIEPRVAGAVDLSHAARTECGLDFVGTEFGAGG